MATPSIPVTLGAPGGKSAQPPPRQEPSAAGDNIDLGEPGNEALEEEADEAALQEVRGGDVDLGEPGNEAPASAPAIPSAGDVDLGAPGNEALEEEPEDAREPTASGSGSIDLGAPGESPLARQQQLARDTAATMDLGPPGTAPSDLPAPARPAGAGVREGQAEDGAGIEIVDLPGMSGADASGTERGRREHRGGTLPEPDTPLANAGGGAADSREDAELPAPVLLEEPEILDLPPPQQEEKSGAARGPDPGTDLPMPSRDSAGQQGDVDLPTPAQSADRAGSAVDLPMPMATSKEASHGTLDDLPQPADAARAPSSGDLPAPKGFFDDLPQPADAARAPSSGDLPAPKGFFDDLPQPADAARAPSSGDLPAPKGMDVEGSLGDLGLGGGSDALGDMGAGQSTEQGGGFDPLGEQGGGFDPLGEQGGATSAAESPPDGSVMDADPFGLGDKGDDSSPLSLANPDENAASPPRQQPYEINALDLEAPRGDDGVGMAPIPLDRTGPAAQPGGDGTDAGQADKPGAGAPDDADPLGLGGGSELGLDLGLPDPSVPGVPAAAQKAQSTAMAAPKAGDGDELGLGGDGAEFGGLELPSIPAASEAPKKPKPKPKKPVRQPPKQAKRRGRDKEEEEVAIGIEESAVPRVVQGHLAASALTERHLARLRQRRKRILMAAGVLVFLGLSTGGVFMYQRWDAERTHKAAVQSSMNTALEHLRRGAPGHWEQAMKAAEQVLELDAKHAGALGLAAEAAYAALLDKGLQADRWRRLGGDFTRRIDLELVEGPHVAKAQALKSIDQGRPKRALERLQAVLHEAPDDPDALLYLGWAHAEAREHEAAAAAFQRALERAPGRKVPALYGLARAQLAQGDRDAARATFEKVLAIRDNHYGALVGKVEAAEVEDPDKHASMYLQLLERDDVDQAAPRAVSRAWMLAGQLSLAAGRVEEARKRFDKAAEINPANSAALVGGAKVALLQERYDDAREALTAVLGTDLENVDAVHHADAVLTAADLYMRTEELDKAESFIDKILDSEQSIKDEQTLARTYVMRGRLLGTDESKREEAVAAYERAREIAGEDALEPALALADLYTTLGRIEQARTVLAPIESRATNDALTAVALGIRYRRAKTWADAESWLRRALELRPGDIDAQFNLGQVLAGQERHDEAIEVLQSAFTAAPERTEIGVRLARLFEDIGRVEDAAAIYERMLEGSSPAIELLAQAGRFYARHDQPGKAGELGDRILSVDENHAAGLFLRGEGLYHRGEYAEARASFQRAVDMSPEPQYLEASARASEQLDLDDEAFEAYSEAARRAPEYIEPRLGRARLLLERRNVERAIEELGETRELAPEEPRLFHLLGMGYQQQDDHRQAISHFRTALGYDERRAETYYRLGRSYLELGKGREAASTLGQATRLARSAGEPAPEWLREAYYELGYVLRSLSKRRRAVEAWRRYLELVPEDRQQQREVIEVKRLLMSLEAQIR